MKPKYIILFIMLKISWLTVAGVMLSIFGAQAQTNLVKNGDFELIDVSIFNSTNSSAPVEWSRVDTVFSRQFRSQFHACVSSKNWNAFNDSTFSNSAFYSQSGDSRSGFVYAKIQPFKRSDRDAFIVQNLVGRLCRPLVAGQRYQLSFWIKQYAGNTSAPQIEVAFRDSLFAYYGHVKVAIKGKKIIPLPPQRITYLPLQADLIIPAPLAVTSTYRQIECDYVARGGERYLYLGNLSYQVPERILRFPQRHGLRKKWEAPHCSYLIDDVALYSSNPTEGCAAVRPLAADISTPAIPIAPPPPMIPSHTDTLIFAAPYFESGQAHLTTVRREQILVQLAAGDWSAVAQVSIIGHTDNVGSEVDNYELSLARARAIAALLPAFEGELKLLGKGASTPLNDNASLAERQANRRVELFLTPRR